MAAAAPTTGARRKRSIAMEREREEPLVQAVHRNDLAAFRAELAMLVHPDRLQTLVAQRRWNEVNGLISTLGRAFTVAMDMHLLDYVAALDEVVVPPSWMAAIKPSVSNYRTNELVFNPSDIYIAVEAQDMPLLSLVFRRPDLHGNLIRRVWLPRTSLGGHYEPFEGAKAVDFFVPFIRHMDMAVFLLAQTGHLLVTTDGLTRLFDRALDTEGVQYVALNGGIDRSVERQAIPRLPLDVLSYILDHASIPLLTSHGEPFTAAQANERVQWDFVNKAVPEAVQLLRVDYYKLIMTSSLWRKSGFDKDLKSIYSHFLYVISNEEYYTIQDLEYATLMATFQVEQLGVNWSHWLGDDTEVVEARLRNNSQRLENLLRVALSVRYVAHQLAQQTVHGKRLLNLATVLASQPYIPTEASVTAARAAFPAGVVLQIGGQVERRVESLSVIYRRVALLLQDAAVFVEPRVGYVIQSEPYRRQIQQLARQVVDRAHAAEPRWRQTVNAALEPLDVPADVSDLITAMRYQREPSIPRRRRLSSNQGVVFPQ